jgi:prophage DNA circulation protein
VADDVTYLPDIPEAESTEVDDQSSVLGLVYNGITPHTKRIKIEDIVKDVADDISDLSTTVSGLGDTVSSLQSTATTLSNDIDAEEAKTTALNSLYGVVTSLAGSVGLAVSSTQDANNNYTAYSLNGNSADAYKPSDLSTWIRRIAQEIEGVTASKDASNVWSLPAYTT